MPRSSLKPVAARLAGLDWSALGDRLDARGWRRIEKLLHPEECAALTALYSRDSLFRSRVVMARHNFGRGEYSYFAYPLPSIVEGLRRALYPELAPVANRWMEAMGLPARYPPGLDAFLEACRAGGQSRPTPLMLRYGTGDYNCLHQDLYGALHFPLQATVLLDRPGEDFEGGEFVLVEQRPRMQSRTEVVGLEGGDAVVFAVNQRPVRGSRGFYRVTMRHGVSEVRSGQRHALGVIFHDAR